MKRFFIALAAMAAMVGCQSVDEPIAIVDNNATLTLSASIVTDDTRVTVGGENFTEVSWEQGDVIRLESMAGMNVKLAATAAGKSNIRFEGEGVAVAEVDTYYAVYPDTNVSNGMVTFNYGEQSGDDVVAALVAMTKDSSMSGLQMEFRPVNALLHVAVSGVESLEKAEFMSFTGAKINSTFTYDFDTDAITYSLPVASLVVEGPAVEGFFFRLPADLDMSAGYIVRLTDASGNVCTKAYNGKVFERGTTTRVDIEWSQPTVTLGAKSSYSYYMDKDIASANKCSGTAIYFATGINGESCASSYYGVQDAVISDLGFDVEGTEYTYSGQQVAWDKSTNTFYTTTIPSYSTTVGEKTSIKAFIKVGDKKYYSSNYVSLTGIPHSFTFYQSTDAQLDSAGWKRNGSSIKMDLLCLKEGGLAGSDDGWVATPAYYHPAKVSTKATMDAKYYVAAIRPSSNSAKLYVGETTSNTVTATSYQTATLTGSNNTTSSAEWSTVSVNLDLSAGTRYVSINHNDATYYSGSRIYVCSYKLEYR
ncbi:MAG: hypothetical protein IJ464_06245 [Alistipes sp.]|nr:hypothetical protein [Alistipes sp.]